MDHELDFKLIKPDHSISHFVESFWLLQNRSESDKTIVVLPDGRVELTISQSAIEPFHIVLSGLETHAGQATLAGKTVIFAISFKLLATEYLFHNTISGFLNHAAILPGDFWDFNANDLLDFDLFCKKATDQIQKLLPIATDDRKQKLFDLIYASKGALTIKGLSENLHWSSRQINRYFNQQFGLSLKTYCSILRFRESLEHVAHGKLFPELNFTDQSHFIKEIKKFSGVVPKELLKNKNDRFIQLSLLGSK